MIHSLFPLDVYMNQPHLHTSSRAVSGDVSEAPFFIVGCSRSGSTLLQALIDAHPRITIPPESQLYLRFADIFHCYGDLRIPAKRRRFIRDLLADAQIRMWGLSLTVDQVESELKVYSRAEIVSVLFQYYARSRGASRWGDKTPEHVRYLSLINTDFPNALFIHLVRDGRDVAEAMRRMVYGPVSAIGLGRMWRDEVLAWKTAKDCIDSSRILQIRYEDLVVDTQNVLECIFDFLGESYIDTTNRYQASALSQTYTKQPWHSSLTTGIRADKIQIYKKRFTPREIELIEYEAGNALENFGYVREYINPKSPSFVERCVAWILDRTVRRVRKLFHPYVIAWDLQYRLRKLKYRLLCRIL
ncbi:sulfotransferase [Rhodocaloribacter litoris]|uniref:sulfotransferase family protein n=1 Tax=Rhodocaloribacter litoris TaxID=2558931 RepID=UPI00141DA50A|nr:sulfotransferase [Rhodocaloribacter litoris]QXD16199.1 sulfotransferase [Rhodocaloribacter litoris]